MTSPTVVFIHIPKTAGSSLRSAMTSVLTGNELLSVYPRAEWATPARAVPDLPSERREAARLVFGHFSHGLHRHFSQPTAYATVVRDPVERVLSAYFHEVRGIERRRVDGRPLTRWQQAIAEDEIDPVAYARGRPPGRRVAHTQNLQTRMIAGVMHVDGDPEHPDLLELALANLPSFAVLGTTQRLGDVAVHLVDAIGVDADLDVPELNRNVGRPRAGDLERADIEEIRDHNRLDVELVAAVRRRIEAASAEASDRRR